MGKTSLVNEMAALARVLPPLKCGTVRYEVIQEDTVASTLALMIDHAFEAANLKEGSLVPTDRRLGQWKALLDVVKIGDLVMSLRRDPARNTRDQFLERIKLVSEKMPDNARVVFVVDPEKYMRPGSDEAWAIVVRGLPSKVKFVFAQRPDGMLMSSESFRSLRNVTRIDVAELDEGSVDELVALYAPSIGITRERVRAAVGRYERHPYAVAAALHLLADGVDIDDLPKKSKPTAFAEAQWNRLCQDHGEDAVRLLQAYAILEIAVPDEIVLAVSGVDAARRHALMGNAFLKALLREEDGGGRLYHALFADHVLSRIDEQTKRQLDEGAVAEYRRRLEPFHQRREKPDALAARRLSIHIRHVEGDGAAVMAFANECTEPLSLLGLLDDSIALAQALLETVADGSVEQAMLLANRGIVLKTRGDLDGAEQMFRKALEIHEKLGRHEGMASNYISLGNLLLTRGDLDGADQMYHKTLEIDEKLGRLEGMASSYINLGIVLHTRGDLDGAEQMYRKALEINEKLGRLEGMANCYGSLGVVLQTRGDLDGAEQMNRKSLKINEKLGRLEGMADGYGNLGNVLLIRGDLDGAEQMHRKSLEIEKKLGRLVGMAADYDNLGHVLRARGDLDGAREHWLQASKLYAEIGMPHMVEKTQVLIDGLPPDDFPDQRSG